MCRASSNLKRSTDEVEEESDVVIGMGGHGDDMAEANLMDVAVAVPHTPTTRAVANGTAVTRNTNNTYTAPTVATGTAPTSAGVPAHEFEQPTVAVIEPLSSNRRSTSTTRIPQPQRYDPDMDPDRPQHLQFNAFRGEQNV